MFYIGVPSEQKYIEMYCEARGIDLPDPSVYSFCMALSIFRIAAILAGVGARAKLGNASSQKAALVRRLHLSPTFHCKIALQLILE